MHPVLEIRTASRWANKIVLHPILKITLLFEDISGYVSKGGYDTDVVLWIV